MIQIEGITKSFGDKTILKGISGTFEKGKPNLIIGASGTGKSVLLKCIVGLVRPDTGHVLYDDRDVRPGQKFADSELMGIPYRITVSDRLLADGQYEYTSRATGETSLLTRDELLAKLN